MTSQRQADLSPVREKPGFRQLNHRTLQSKSHLSTAGSRKWSNVNVNVNGSRGKSELA